MSSNARPAFVRRPTRDRAVESICNRCKAVVATSHLRTELERAEHAHVCDFHALPARKKMSSPDPGKVAPSRSDAA